MMFQSTSAFCVFRLPWHISIAEADGGACMPADASDNEAAPPPPSSQPQQLRSAALLVLLCISYACVVQQSLVSDIMHQAAQKRAAALFRSSAAFRTAVQHQHDDHHQHDRGRLQQLSARVAQLRRVTSNINIYDDQNEAKRARSEAKRSKPSQSSGGE